MQNNSDRAFIIAITVWAVVAICFFVAVIWVAAHFIRKYW